MSEADDKGSIIHNAFEGVESPENYRSKEDIEVYRRMLLEKTEAQSGYIQRHIGDTGNVFEAGTGNGRLLLSLALRGAIEKGLGVDVAQSRIDFANLWAKDLALDARISFKTMDLLAFPEPSASYSMCICITGAFGYFPFLRENGDSLTLDYFNRLLDSNGWLLLELYNHPVNKRRCLEEKDNVYRHWEELPEQDPFSHYLSERTFDPASRVMRHRKIFVRRSDGFIDDSRMEALRLYERGEVMELLESRGFEVLRFDSDWRDTVFKDGDEVSVVLARKK